MLVVHEACGEVNDQVDGTTQARDPWFRFFVDDWRAGTNDMSYEQKGIYIDLLCLTWDRKGDLPSNTDDLAKLLRRDRRNVRRLVGELVAAKKFRDVGGKLVNGKMSKLILEQKKQVEAASKPRKAKKEWKSGGSPAKVSEKSPRSLGERTDDIEEKQEVTASHQNHIQNHSQKEEGRSKDLLSSIDDAPVPKAKRSKPTIDVDALAAFNAYNDLALRIGIPQASTLTPQRRKSICARIREHGGMDAWAKALANVEASSFLRGGGPRGWTATLNFLLQASSFAKVLDGGFADRTPLQAPARNETENERIQRELMAAVMAPLTERAGAEVTR